MSYQSRVYRQRNPQVQDAAKKEPFFSKLNDQNKSKKNNSFFQAKLSVNKPGDSHENEADNVANAVVNKSAKVPMIQRLATSSDDEKLGTNDERMKHDKEIQRKENVEDKKEKKKGIQMKSDSNTATASSQLSSRVGGASGQGSQLPKQTLHEMNSSFGVDFSGVRIHNDSNAADMSKQLHAQAFTHGNDIYFNQGKYNPDNSQGKFLLAHELTHVVQQSGSKEKISRQVIDANVSCSEQSLTDLGLTRQQVIDTISDADAQAIEMARNAEDQLTANLASVRAGDEVDADFDQILQEELGLTLTNASHFGLIQQQINRFRRVRETLESGFLRFQCLAHRVQLVGCSATDCGDNRAFSCPANRLIDLCQAFWDNPDEQKAVVVHEPFHILFSMLRHNENALRRADASCFESFALRVSGFAPFRSCAAHTAG